MYCPGWKLAVFILLTGGSPADVRLSATKDNESFDTVMTDVESLQHFMNISAYLLS